MGDGLERFWNGVIFLNRLTRGRPIDAKAEADRRGWSGAVNVVVAGNPGGVWSLVTKDGLSQVERGEATSPIATIRLDEDALFRMLRGEATMFSLTLTGAVTCEGDGLATMALWTMISQLRAAAQKGGPVGWLMSWWMKRVLAP